MELFQIHSLGSTLRSRTVLNHGLVQIATILGSEQVVAAGRYGVTIKSYQMVLSQF